MKFSKLFLSGCLSFLAIFMINANAANIDHGAHVTRSHKTEKVSTKVDSVPVNINSADAKTLATLKGIGSKKAQAIIDYRNQNGSFKSVDDLANVKGIGKKRLAKILADNPNRMSVSN